ncbi:MAG TPA: galactose-1-epimerase [Firmicutes bacterium]|jgi:aldose 1-epimerase|nr:galactose-1-epimerase [Bacillota bacterium]
MDIQKEPFGIHNGKEVFLFTLRNNKNMAIKIMSYGGIITSIVTPDSKGKPADVVLGFNTLQEYEAGCPFFGALVGRYGNRIGKAKFTLNGKEYQLAHNDGKNHLHGGIVGFDKVVWDVEPIKNNDGVALKLTYHSKDGEEGYPGNLQTTVTYLLTDQNELKITYEAKTDKPTVINLTQHSYFNLAGEGSGDVREHELEIHADRYTVTDNELIPTGELRAVKGTALDFTKSKTIGTGFQQNKKGFDDNYVLQKEHDGLTLAAKVHEPKSGRSMEVYTTQPAIQLYTAGGIDGTLKGKSGHFYQQYGALCLETQHFPDSPNQPGFPTTVLNPGENYHQITIYKFS